MVHHEHSEQYYQYDPDCGSKVNKAFCAGHAGHQQFRCRHHRAARTSSQSRHSADFFRPRAKRYRHCAGPDRRWFGRGRQRANSASEAAGAALSQQPVNVCWLRLPKRIASKQSPGQTTWERGFRIVSRKARSHYGPNATYSISSSAMLSRPDEMVRPRALAVVMLMVSSNLVGCSTGRSVGFLPMRIWAVRVPPCRYRSTELAP